MRRIQPYQKYHTSLDSTNREEKTIGSENDECSGWYFDGLVQ